MIPQKSKNMKHLYIIKLEKTIVQSRRYSVPYGQENENAAKKSWTANDWWGVYYKLSYLKEDILRFF